MESSSNSSNMGRQRRSGNSSEGVDYISHLPEAIMLYILSLLPIKDLMVVSLLSRLWKSMVVNHLSIVPSSLNLDEFEAITSFITETAQRHQCSDFHSLYGSPEYLTNLINAARSQYMDYVNRTLMLHTGCTINKLELSFCYDGSDMYTGRLTRWVHFAFTNKIKSLDFDFSKAEMLGPTDFLEPYELPNRTFSPRMLRKLTLTYCKLRGINFGIMWYLKKLSLRQVTILECSIGQLASKCPVLEDVSLEQCVIPNEFMVSEPDIMFKRLSLIDCKTEEWPMFSIQISTPELLILTVVGKYLMASSIRNAVQLLNVTIDIEQVYADHVQGDALGSLLIGLDHCKTLTLTTWCIQVLPTGEDFLEQLPNPLQDLLHLKLILGLGKQELPGIACLIRSCPNLEILTLTVEESIDVDWAEFQEDIPDILDFEEYSYWDLQELPFDCMENSLRQVKITGFTGKSNEIQMVKFLLENAEVLEKMEIFLAETGMIPSNRTERYVNGMWYQDNSHYLLTFPRVAPEAHVAVFKNLGLNMRCH